MDIVPIISISLNESLKRFLDKLVSRNQYENKSKLVRDALLRLMSTIDSPGLESSYELATLTKSVIGNMIIILPNDPNIQKKLNSIESQYQDEIISKNSHYQRDNITIFMIFEGTVDQFQKFVVEVNGIKELINFRYLILT